MKEGGHLARAHEPATRAAEPVEGTPPTVGDLLRHLWARRVRLLVSFVLLTGFGAAALLGWWLFGQRQAQAVLALDFRGIERHEYPSGKKFLIEDIRSPRVLAKALDDLGVPEASRELQDVYRGIDLVPVVPSSVLARWKKQDRDGAKREEYLPSEFELDVHPRGFDDTERVRLVYALLSAYQGQVKRQQLAEARRVARFATMPPDELVALYDYWDIPILLRAHAENVGDHLDVLIRESENFRDPELKLGFREVRRNLRTWTDTRLEALAALVHHERLVKDRDAMLRRLEERAANVEIEQRKASDEAAETTKLLEVVDRPKALLAGQLTTREGAPLVDVTMLEKLVKTDYVGPVVRRVSELHQQAAAAAATKERVQNEIGLLAKASPGGVSQPPREFASLVALAVKDLDRIVDDYLEVLDAYLDATVASQVTLREGPYLRLRGPEVRFVAVAVVFTAAILSLLFVLASDSVRRRPPGSE